MAIVQTSPEVETQEGYMSDIYPWTYVRLMSPKMSDICRRKSRRDTCLFHRLDFPNQTSLSLYQFQLSVRLVQIQSK